MLLASNQDIILGHVIDGSGVHVDPDKVEAIYSYPNPSNIKKLRTFLAMASCYRKFCLGFSKQAGCLFALIKVEVE